MKFPSLEAKLDYKEYLERAAQNSSTYAHYLKRLNSSNNFSAVEITVKDLKKIAQSEIPHKPNFNRFFYDN